MNTEMIAKEPVVKLLQEIKANLDDMGKAGLKGELRNDAASYVFARLSGKIEQYLEGIDKESGTMHGMTLPNGTGVTGTSQRRPASMSKRTTETRI